MSLKSVFLLATLVASVVAVPLVPVPKDDMFTYGYRLPNATRPITYNVQLTTNVDTGDTKFSGIVDIEFEAVEVVVYIFLHARQLTINSVELSLAWMQNNPIIVTYTYNEEHELLIVTVPGGLFFGAIYRMTIAYEGNLRSDSGGFYMQSYKNTNGQDVYLATTQFESTNARHAFPCYDEPDKKAIFTISITHARRYSAISNMPVMGEIVNNGDGTATTHFEPTRLMSSYLIAFTISDYTYTEKTSGIPHRIYSKPGFAKQHEFALDTSIATLDSQNINFGVKYPLPKMDNVAIPAKGGAMENWGLVTYGEQYLLYDEQETTTSSKTTIATIISHEFAHQWFGDFVSPKWWTYIWLNEGFASLYEYETTDQVYPEWDMMQLFVTGYLQRSLLSDTRVNPRPMTAYSDTPSGISGLFDYVSYGKAGSVLRMIQHAFTDSTFRKALKLYLKKLDYKSAIEDDLFQGFKDATYEDGTFLDIAVDLDGMLRSWTNQGGFPLITVTRNYEAGSFVIKQEPYDGSAAPNASDTRSWWVPCNFATSNDSDFTSTNMEGYLLPGMASSTFASTDSKKWSKDDWIILNKQATSFYRVLYDDENLRLITTALLADHRKIHKHNRAQLIDDVYAMIASSRSSYSKLFDLLTYMKNETDYAPWATTTTILGALNNRFLGNKDYYVFQFFTQKIVENFYAEVGVSEKISDLHLTKMIRSTAINWACRSGLAGCLDATNKKLKDFAQNGVRIEPDLRTSIMCTGAMKASQLDLGLLLKKLATIEVQLQRNQIMSGLGCLSTGALLKEYLETSIKTPSEQNYSASERLQIVGYVVEKSAEGVKAAIEFLLSRHNEYGKLSSTNAVLPAIRSIAARINTAEQSTQFETLLDRVKSMDGIQSSHLDSVRSTVASNLKWVEVNGKEIIDWMQKFYKDNGGKDGGDGATSIVASTSVIVAVVFVSLRTLF